MATVNGTEYDHIDIVNGSTTTKHMLKDTTARGDIENLKSALRITNETVVNVDTTGATIKTWMGLTKTLVVQKGLVSGKSGIVHFSFYSLFNDWSTKPIVFVLLCEDSGKLVVVDKINVVMPHQIGWHDVATSWNIEADKTYYIGLWSDRSNFIPYIENSVYGTYTKAVWSSIDDIVTGAEIQISSMSNITWNTVLLNISVMSDIGVKVDGLKKQVTDLKNGYNAIADDVGDLDLLNTPANSLVEAINGLQGQDVKISDYPTTTASAWAGVTKGIAILNVPIIHQSGKVKLTFYNLSTHSSWVGHPFVFVLYERTGADIFTVVAKKSVEMPDYVGAFDIDPGWTITDDRIYYVGVWRTSNGWIPYISGGDTTMYKAAAYDAETDIAVGSTLALSGLSYASNTMLLNISVLTDGNHTDGHIAKRRMVHFSVDDCVFWADLIVNADTYTSCFENPQLKRWKKLHDIYGCCVTFNCFCSDGTYSIADVPNKFADEFVANADWLKFAFHAQDATTYYDTDSVDAITASYETFVDAIITMTGTLDAIDPVTRLGFYTGSLANIQAIRDANCGITGLLTSDDTRVSYYLSTAQNNYILTHNRIIDTDNHILLIHTMPRLESVNGVSAALETYISKDYQNKNQILEFFTHETTMTDNMVRSVEIYCVWALLIGATFDFATNWMPGLC